MSQISDEDLKSQRIHFNNLKKEKLTNDASQNIAGLLKLIKNLRDEENGCPWDKKQTLQSFSECITEEAQETIDSINSEDFDNLEEELGDLLFSVLFTINLCEEKKKTTLEKVTNRVLKKLVYRHPHVFGHNPPKNISSEEAYALFQSVKKLEKSGKLNYSSES